MTPTDTDSAQYYQAVLDSRPQDELLERLRRLCGLRCSGSVLVVEADVVGVVFLDQGRVADALVIDGPWIGEGIEALSYLTNLSHPLTTYQAASHFGRRTIDAEFADIKDLVERLQPLFAHPSGPPPQDAPEPEEQSPPGGETQGAPEGDQPSAPTNEEPPVSTAAEEAPTSVAVNTLLRDLREVRGYRGAAITDAAGEPLWSDTAGEIDLPLLAGVWNDVFRTLDDVSQGTDMGTCVSAVVHALEGVAVIHCGGTEGEGPHLHAVALLAPDGNQALMRLHLERALPRVRAALI